MTNTDRRLTGWSTSEVARLAGVSLRTVRYYHEVGLLAEPERRTNGYKAYGALHLIRLLRIRRLTEIGFTLAQIRELDSKGPQADALFRSLDAQLSERIEQLEQIRRDLQQVLSNEVHRGMPPGFADVETAATLTDTDKATLFVLSRLLPEHRQRRLREWLSTAVDSDADADFERLPADAGEAERAELAVRMLPAARAAKQHRPADEAPVAAARDIGLALRDIYNAAQLDVLVRVSRALEAESAEH
ncbi:MerR family transcriptional regulator [Nakamurella aerolata]|uniref:MerR family transcriptional regulator n=1 Tax=Nakamurella aerolata TaxID=1656892 RepID=A0A849ACM8_9ACTN|nr:MerR family transcriptional regulator [Nakamurella aerolata]NNG37483.1 MerR family transcriptional regulator [Nakamurella aerolata]